MTAFAWLNNVTAKAHRLPKALIIGCKKSGTGWLIVHFHILEQSKFAAVKAMCSYLESLTYNMLLVYPSILIF